MRPKRARAAEPKPAPQVEYQVESGAPTMVKKPSREPIMFGDEQKDLYQTFYNQEKHAQPPVGPAEVQGRRCLFHGEAAATACPNCSSLLCDECVRGGLCPRCHAPIEGGRKAKKAAPAPKKDPRAILEESDAQEPEPEAESEEDKQSKDWSRL
jgi:hypothetical protein